MFNQPGGSYVGSSVGQFGCKFDFTVNQTGTAGFTNLNLGRTNTALGSGVQRYLRCHTGGVTHFAVNSDGDTLIFGALDHDGTTVGFYSTTPTAQSAAYSILNVSTDRAYNAGSVAINELANVVGTLIADLQLTGIIG